MAKASSLYRCQNCSATHLKWQGQCNQCGEWDTLVEEVVIKEKSGLGPKTKLSAGEVGQKIVAYGQVKNSAKVNRISTQLDEFDRVLGGEKNNFGMVPGAVMLIGGEPGIGKSTILTQVVINIAKHKSDFKIMYVCGEESPEQISLRIKRILSKEQNKSSKKDGLESLSFVTTTDVDELNLIIDNQRPHLIVVDSIQAMTTMDLSGAAGSVGQVREAADRLTDQAKKLHIPLFLVGHVTKDGTIAGPKTLEHVVDAVLELSGERTGELRLLRSLKNRFGATDEVGVFKVDEVGLAEVTNPAEFFLEHTDQPMSGSATTCVMEGTRPLLLEVQALVTSSQLAMPRRVGRGVDLSRIQVLAAVLQKHARQPFGSHDVFVSAAGGYRVKETGIDLGLAMAMVSSLKNKPLPKNSVFIGEVGLLGEIRHVNYLERRIKEAKRLGYKKIYSKKSHQTVKSLLNELKL